MKERPSSIKSNAILQLSTIWLLGVLVFVGIFANGWTYDDFPVIVENPDIRSITAFLADSYPGRPLRELTFLVDHALFGLDPYWWHLQQIFWHMLNATLVYFLAQQLGGGRMLAWLAASLFVVHPLQVEVVANISHRKDSLALAFSLLSALSYIKFVSEDRRWVWLPLSICFWVVALYSKQIAICLPAFFLAYEYYRVDQGRRFLLIKSLPYIWAALAVTLGLGALAWFVFGGGHALYLEEIRGHLQLKANYFAEPNILTYAQMVFKSWAFMFLKYLIPVGLAPEYTFSVPAGWSDPWVLAGIAGLGAIAGLIVVFRNKPLVPLALVLVAVFWLPVTNLWPLAYFAADRYMYAPSAGVFIAIAYFFTRTFRRKALLVAVLPVLTLLAAITVNQVRVWRSPLTLWSHALEVSPRSTFALNNMGNNHLLQGDLASALAYYRRSVEINATNPEAQYNLGLIYERLGQIRKARKHYRNFIALAPGKYSSQIKHLKERYNFE